MSFTMSGCAGMGYYVIQAGRGQLAILNHTRPVEEVLGDPRVSERVKRLLSEVQGMKAFGETRGLKPTSNYTQYVDLNREAVVWVVSACSPLEFKSKTWSFPLVGSFTYLGWFDASDAEEYAESLRAEGLDVDRRPASAYSTLGWFRDPLLSTMIPQGDSALGGLANIVLHESVHATFYIDGQSTFNESLASFVANQLTPDYLTVRAGRESLELKSYLTIEAHSRERGARMRKAYEELDALYRSNEPSEVKLKRKAEILAALREETRHRREITNATLVQYTTYATGEKEFSELFAKCGKQWPRFWDAMKRISEDSFPRAQDPNFGKVIIDLQCTN